MTSRPLSHLPGVLAARFGATDSAVPDLDSKNAAVALILRPPEGERDCAVHRCDVLAIRRAQSDRDPWSGQMALPGGALEERDARLLDAATREVHEETGLCLDGTGAVLGRIERVRPLGPRLPNVSVWPFVLRAPARSSARVASREVASVHWFPVVELMRRSNRGSHAHTYAGRERWFPCIRIEGRVIWGLTYRIVTQFLDLVAQPPKP